MYLKRKKKRGGGLIFKNVENSISSNVPCLCPLQRARTCQICMPVVSVCLHRLVKTTWQEIVLVLFSLDSPLGIDVSVPRLHNQH